MNKEMNLPVDQAEIERKKNMEQGTISKNINETFETITDDILSIPEEKKNLILASEHIVREALALFDIDYDALIDMNQNSVYGEAVKQDPRILEAVIKSENPVLFALKIAMGFKPYAEFMGKYGKEPEAIREAIRKELMQELKAQKNKPTSSSVYSPAFAKTASAKQKVEPVKTGLDAIFKR